MVPSKALSLMHSAPTVGALATKEYNSFLPLLVRILHVLFTSPFHTTNKIRVFLLGSIFSTSNIVARFTVKPMLDAAVVIYTILWKLI